MAEPSASTYPARRSSFARARGALLCLVAVLLPIPVAASWQRPAFTTTVATVRVDVIVSDDEGRFVDDLRPDEFVLYEDEVEQPILGAQIVDLRQGTVAEFVPASVSARGAIDARPSAQLAPRPVPAAASRDFGAIIFLVDLPGLDRRNKDRFAEAWLEVIDGGELLGVPRAVYMIDQGGRLRELAPLSLSADAFRHAVDEVLEAPLVRRGIHDRLLRVAADILADDVVDFADPQANDLNEVRVSEAEERARSRRTLELLTQFCNALSARQGRTALIWVSSEILLAEGGPGTALAAAYAAADDPGFDSGAVDRSRRTGNALFSYLSIDTRISALQGDLHRAANSANVSIYTLDPAPESEHRSMPIDVRVGSPGLADLMESTIVQTSLDGLKDALWQTAEETGGLASIGATDLDAALRGIDDDTSRFYLLSYAPPSPRGDGAFRSIRVVVRRAGVAVRQRSGYVDLSPEDRVARALAAALVLPGSVNTLPVEVRALHGWSREGAPIVKLVVALEQGPARQQAGLPEVFSHQIHGVALDADGEVVGEVDQQMQLNGPPSRRIRYGTRPAVYVHDWSLPPGSFDVRLAVRDAASGDIGAAGLQIVVPQPSSDWRASDLMLAAADENGVARPLLGRSIFADEPLFAYVEVRGGENPALSGYILDAEGSERLAEMPETFLVGDAAGIHRGALRLRNLTPGDYVLEVVLTDHGPGKEQTFRVPLQVLGV